jgi:diguanylate cyclase (GGDEF)-like protein/PAS domain S-box-containing protein
MTQQRFSTLPATRDVADPCLHTGMYAISISFGIGSQTEVGAVRRLSSVGRTLNSMRGSRSRAAMSLPPSDTVVLTRVLAYLQVAGACVAALWLVVPPVGHANRLWVLVIGLAGIAFAAALSRVRVCVRPGTLAAVSLLSTALLGSYTAFVGEVVVPFSLLYLAAGGVAIWCFSGRRAIVQVVWVLCVFTLAAWFSSGPHDPPWPRLPAADLKSVLVWGIALGASAVLIKVFKGAVVDRDQRLAAIVGSSDDAIIGKDRNGVITVWNLGAERLYGYSASEAIGQQIGMLIPPSRVGEDQELLQRVLAGEHVERFPTERVCKDGSVVIVSVSLSPVRDAAQRVVGASSIARDITSEVRSRRQIAVQAELLDEVDAAVIATDTEWVVQFWSRGAEQLYGYRASEAIGQPIADLIVPARSRAAMTKLADDALAGLPADAELDAQNRTRGVFPVYLRLRALRLDGDDGVAGIIGVSVDISARREAEQVIVRHAQQQEEIATVGRLALQGDSLAELFDYTVRAASRTLSADCARVVERVPDRMELVVRAGVGWHDAAGKGELEAGDPQSISGFAAGAADPVLVDDWQQERRFQRSSRLLARGVRASVAVRIGDPGRSFGALEVHYTRPEVLPPSSVTFLEALANVLAEAINRRDASETIRVQALHDGLTGLPNRTLFHDRVTHALARNDRTRKRLAVFLVDVDHFKLVNDSLGHDAGDELLRLLVPRLAGVIREGDTLARLGGDQFAVLCEELPSEPAAVRIANQLINLFERPIALRGEEHLLGASVGIAVSTGGSTATSLLRDVDVAMYHAKKAGGRRFELFDQGMRDRVLGRVRTELALRSALANDDEIHVNYQPLVSLRTGRIVGAEALARWRHPDWGPVSPVEFIPVAEDSGLIHELGKHVVLQAVRESAAWQDIADFAGVAVNVSTRQLVDCGVMPGLLADQIAAAGIAPGFLTVEVTESLLIEEIDVALTALNAIKDLGVNLSLDDFGTGYSSLSYLRDLPLDVVKIDRSLIRGILDLPHAVDIPVAIVQMAHALDLKVIAEGVETLEQARRLQQLGCDTAQGFYFGKPMAAAQLSALLLDQPHWLPKPSKQPRRAPRQQPLAERAARSGRKPSRSQAYG